MELLANHVAGAWSAPATDRRLPVVNPATGKTLAEAPLSGGAEVDRAVEAAAAAFPEWRRTPAGDRIQVLFRVKSLLEAHLDSLARTITEERGKTLAEPKGELRRGIENVEVAWG